MLANELSNMGMVENAISLLTKFIVKHPTDHSAFRQRALAHLGLEPKNYKLALNDINTAINLSPKDSELYTIKAYIYYELGSFYESGRQNIIAIKLDSKNAVAMNNLGRAHFSIGENAEAIEWYKFAIKVNPKNPLPYFNIAWTLEHMGNHADATKWYEECLKRSSGSEDFYNTAILRINSLKK